MDTTPQGGLLRRRWEKRKPGRDSPNIDAVVRTRYLVSDVTPPGPGFNFNESKIQDEIKRR